MDKYAERQRLLGVFAQEFFKSLGSDTIYGRPITLERDATGASAFPIAGPRSGALEVLGGFQNGKLLQVLTANDAAILRRLVPWQFPPDKSPVAYLHGSCLRLEAAWPEELQTTDIRLGREAPWHKDGRRMTVGLNEQGQTIRFDFDSETPHVLVAGATGSGKTFLTRSLTLQMARGKRQMVLIDGKFGDGLKNMDGLPGVVGPMAHNADGLSTIQNALGWAYNEMRRRYTQEDKTAPKLIVVLDEIQEITSDQVVSELIRKIGAMGRGAGVHLLVGTQYPRADMFGADKRANTLKQHFVGRIVLAVGTPEASMLAVGDSTPRADRILLGRGDAYVLPRPGLMYRTQCAYVPENEIGALVDDARNYNQMRPIFQAWPEFDASTLDSFEVKDKVGRRERNFTGVEIAKGILQAAKGGSRDALMQAVGKIGAGAATRLLDLGEEVHYELMGAGYTDKRFRNSD